MSHLVVIVLCIIVCILSPRSISTNFMDIIPNNGISSIMKDAEKTFTKNQDRSVVIYVGATEKEHAIEAVKTIVEELSATGMFENIDTGASDFDLTALQNFVSENAMLLLDEKTCNKIKEDPHAFTEDSLSRIFGAFTVSSLDNIDIDPFLLSENVWLNYISNVSSLTSFSPDGDFLTEEFDGKTWVLLNCLFNKEAVSVANSGSIKKFFSVCDTVQDKFPDCEIVYSGIALHSGESASNSQKEITLITVVSLVAMIVLFLFACRNLNIIKLFITSLVLSFVSAISVLLIFFKEVHVMTLLFGTTLMGTCIDYSIHFYIRYAQRGQNENAVDVSKNLKKSLSISFGSTAICYLILIFSRYSLLRQIAVFSATGLFSSFLTTLYFYPYTIKPSMVKAGSFISIPEKNHSMPNWLIYIFSAIATLILIISIPHIKIKNNISALYEPSARLMACESRASEIIGYNSTTYGIVTAETSSSVLDKEYDITEKLDQMIEEEKLAGYVATSLFIPTISQQEQSLEAAKLLLPYLDTQAAILGLDDKSIAIYKEKLATKEFIYVDNLPENVKNLISNVSLGKVDDSYCEVIIIKNATDNTTTKEIFDSVDGAHYFQTATDISNELDQLTNAIFKLLIIAFGVILISLMIIFGMKEGFRMSLSPYCIISLTISASWIFGFAIDFFYVVGLVLSIGLGLDYMVFACEKGPCKTGKAVLLSFVTTELSFGTLILSSFRPIHIFGFTVFTGILIAYMVAIISRRTSK